jgi:cobalt-zinc-cadmium efflux system outer membrane protein
LSLAAVASAAPVSLESALERAVSAAELPALERAAEEAAEAHRRGAASLPNPSVFFEYEKLDASRGVEGSRETTAGLSTPLDFIWKRGARIEAAERRGEIARLQIENERRQLTREIAELYVRHTAAHRELTTLDGALEALQEVRRVAIAAVEAGEAPATDQRRLDLALSQHRQEAAAIEARLLSLERRLGALVADPEATPEPGLQLDSLGYTSEGEAVAAARENRPDLRAALAMESWMQAEANAASREGLPSASLDLGLKEADGGRDGVYVGVVVELPIFGESRAPAQLARSEARRATIALRQAQRTVEGEAAAAFWQWHRFSEFMHTPATPFAENDPETATAYLRSTTASFVAGESTLLEQLDAVRAFIEATRSEIQFEESLRLAAIALADATGAPVPMSSQPFDQTN